MVTKWLIPLAALASCTAAAHGEDTLFGTDLALFKDDIRTLAQFDGNASSGQGDWVCRGQDKASCLDWILPRSHLPLPLMKGLVENFDVTLPLPLGTSAIWTEMDRTVAVTDIRLGVNGNPPETMERFTVPETKFHASSAIGRVDLWVLPFVNVYGVVGHTTSSGRIEAIVEDFPFPASPSFDLPIEVTLRGPTYGFGTTIGIGTKRYFLMVDANRTWTDFSALNSEMVATVVAPRLGRVIKRPWFKGAVHVGAMYQDTAQTAEVLISRPGIGDILVSIDQVEPRNWNFLVGGLWGIDERLHLMLEGGMGGRSYMITGLTVRY